MSDENKPKIIQITDNVKVKVSECKNCNHEIGFVMDSDFPQFNEWQHFNPAEGDYWKECYWGNCCCTEPVPKENADICSICEEPKKCIEVCGKFVCQSCNSDVMFHDKK